MVQWRTPLPMFLTRFVRILLLVSAFSLMLTLSDANALTVEEYCQLTIDILKVSIDEGNERLILVNQYGKEPTFYFRESENVTKKYQGRRAEFYTKYGTSESEYSSFMREYGEAVNSFLENNAEVRDSIDTLISQRNSVGSQLESAVINSGLHSIQ